LAEHAPLEPKDRDNYFMFMSQMIESMKVKES
jgi:hypothetical protein